MRKIYALGAAVALAVVTGLSGCSVKDNSGNSSTDSAKQEISFLTFESPNLTPAYWDAAIKRVTDKHPNITVKRLTAPSAGDRTNYAKQLLQSGQFPDVMIAISASGFAEAGNLADWSATELKDFQFPEAGLIKGKIYQLPANTQTIPPIYYNKKMFADAGITATPKTWQELLDASAKLKAKNVTPFVVGGGKDAFASGLILTGAVSTDVYGATPDWMTQRRADKVKFADPTFVKAATKVADLAKQGYINKQDVSRDYAATEQAFLDGKGAMYPMGNWFASAADTKKPAFDIGVFNFPTDSGKALVPAYVGGGLTVSAKAKNLKAAKEFALAFQLDKDNLDNSVKADGLIPAIKGYTPPTDTGPVYKAGYELYQQGVKDNTVIHAFNWETADDGPRPGVADKIWAGAQDLISGNKTPQQVAETLDAEWAKAG
jgi:ABC-type glycerol-3-phosphate transport system substrate-binding protein